MALLFLDGQGHLATADIAAKWGANANFSIDTTGGPRGGRCLFTTSNASYVTRSVTVGGSGAVWCGFRYKAAALGGMIWTCLDGVSGYPHTGIRTNSDGSVSAVRAGSLTTPYHDGGNVLGTSAPGLITAGQWPYIEVKELVHASTGTIQIKINGVSALNLTGQATKNTNGSAAATITQVALVSNSVQDQWFADFYCLDDSGSINNDYLGDIRVDAHLPDGDGNTQNSTPSSGSDQYAMVDETTPDGDTTYNTLASAGDKDTLTFPALAATGVSTVLGFQVCMYARKTDAGTGSIAAVVRSGGTDYDGSTVTLNTSYGYVLQPYDANPATSARMTATEFGDAEFGYKRID
jgi:hypothetical protein